jgi:hypothetical protein
MARVVRAAPSPVFPLPTQHAAEFACEALDDVLPLWAIPCGVRIVGSRKSVGLPALGANVLGLAALYM